MSQRECMKYIQEAVYQFSDPILYIEKANRFSKQAQRAGLKMFIPKVVLLYDSRIMLPPDLVFSQNLGDAYVVQALLDDCKSLSLTASIEFGIKNHGCNLLVVAIPTFEPDDSGRRKTKVDQILSDLTQRSPHISQSIRDGSLSVVAFSVDGYRKNVSEVAVA